MSFQTNNPAGVTGRLLSELRNPEEVSRYRSFLPQSPVLLFENGEYLGPGNTNSFPELLGD